MSTTASSSRRPARTARTPRRRDPFADIAVTTVTHDIRERTVMYPVPAVATVTDRELWTPARLREPVEA